MTDDDKALVERLRDDWPEILVEKHWMMDSDAIDKQRAEAADRIEAQAQKINILTKANELWFEKTEWVQKTAQTQEFGLHRADVLRLRIEALSAENERLREALAKSEALQDLAYYNGAKQYASICAQSEDAARDWLNGGCGNRQRDAIAALGDTK